MHVDIFKCHFDSVMQAIERLESSLTEWTPCACTHRM